MRKRRVGCNAVAVIIATERRLRVYEGGHRQRCARLYMTGRIRADIVVLAAKVEVGRSAGNLRP